MEAAVAYQVSPYYLAGKIRQEVILGNGQGSNSVTGTVAEYPGIYNFYNIGANSGTNPIGNGLNWAKNGGTTYQRPWTDPEKSIKGGAGWIADGYINVGQDTGYLQKFNVNPSNISQLYKHQYMQNVAGATSEAVSTYNGYVNNGTLADNKVFYIPVYDNMPATPCYRPSGFSDAETDLYTINGTGVRMRGTPSTSGTILKTCNLGETVKMLENNVAYANGYTWAKVQAENGTIGYVATIYLTARQSSAISVASVSLDKSNIELEIGDIESISATISPSNATNKNVTWSSSNNNIATVSNGVITAKSPGTATITIITEDGNKQATCSVKVLEPIDSISLDKDNVTIDKLQSTTLTATISPSEAANRKIIWETSNASVVTVNNGVVTAVGGGTATITARVGIKSASCSFTVISKVEGVSLSESSKSVTLEGIYYPQVIISPSDATNKGVTWSSSNPEIATVDQNGKVKGVSMGTANITVKTIDGNKVATCKVTITELEPSVKYYSHVQDIGWEAKYAKANGDTSGTTGQDKRLEAISIQLEDCVEEASILYQAHVEDIGWQNWMQDGATAGTVGEGKRIEAIRIKVQGLDARYSVQYRAYVAGIGWQNWVEDGLMAGTTGSSKRLEAIQIKIVDKKRVSVEYYSHIQDIGWESPYSKIDGAISGTSGQSKRLEGIYIRAENLPKGGSIEYQTHVQDIGWQDWAKDGSLAGTTSQSKRLEAIRIRFNNVPGYTLEYRVHVQDIGWQDWVRNGEIAGTTGQSKRLEAIQIRVVKM